MAVGAFEFFHSKRGEKGIQKRHLGRGGKRGGPQTRSSSIHFPQAGGEKRRLNVGFMSIFRGKGKKGGKSCRCSRPREEKKKRKKKNGTPRNGKK